MSDLRELMDEAADYLNSLNETNGKDLSLEESKVFEDFVKSYMPKDSRIRWNNNKMNMISSVWGNIRESRIGKHGQLVSVKNNGDVIFDGDKIIDGKKSPLNINFYKMLKYLVDKMKKSDIDGIDYFKISLDESDTANGEMFNAVFDLRKIK